MITHTLLELHAVSIGNGYVVHVHTEHQTANVLGISHTCGYASPNGNLLLGCLVFPIAANHLARYTHTGADMSELDVSVGALVQVHEVHIHRLPGDLGIILCVEVEERLLQILQTLDPHLGGAEGVHPGDDTYALLVVVGSFHLLRTVGCTFIYYLDGDDTAVVQTSNHLLRVSVNCHDCITSIKELCTSYPPNLVILKCFNHNCCTFLSLFVC